MYSKTMLTRASTTGKLGITRVPKLLTKISFNNIDFIAIQVLQ